MPLLCFQAVAYRWGRNPTPGCQCCGSPAGFLPSESGAPLWLPGPKWLLPSNLCLAWGRCLQWDIPFPVCFSLPFCPFFPLCLLWNVPMEVKPLGLTPVLLWILPSYWKSSFRAQPSGQCHGKTHPISLCLLSWQPWQHFQHVPVACWPQAVPWGGAGWLGRGSAAAPPAWHVCWAQDRALWALWSFCWALLLSLSWVTLGAFSSAVHMQVKQLFFGFYRQKTALLQEWGLLTLLPSIFIFVGERMLKFL